MLELRKQGGDGIRRKYLSLTLKDKSTSVKWRGGANFSAMLAASCIGYASKKGIKPGPNQDDFFIYAEGGFKMCGVFDGHGANGHIVSNLAQWLFPKVIVVLLRIANAEEL